MPVPTRRLALVALALAGVRLLLPDVPLAQGLLVLDGLPNLQDLGKLLIGETAIEILSCDLKLEVASQTVLKEAVAHCETVRDYVSREIFEDILKDTEEHIDHLQTQIELVGKVGEQNYLQSQMGEASGS